MHHKGLIEILQLLLWPAEKRKRLGGHKKIMTLRKKKKKTMKEIPSNFSNPSWNTFSLTRNGRQIQRNTTRHDDIVADSHYQITGVNKRDSDYSEKVVTL